MSDQEETEVVQASDVLKQFTDALEDDFNKALYLSGVKLKGIVLDLNDEKLLSLSDEIKEAYFSTKRAYEAVLVLEEKLG